MKNTFIMLVIALLSGSNLFAQKLSVDKVPASVLSAFKVKFPSVTNSSWEKENATEYEANFKTGKTEQSALFDKDGKWLETETGIEVSALPKAVAKTLASQYATYKIKEAEKADTHDKGQLYEVELSKAGETLDVQLSAEGKVLGFKKESKVEED